MMRTLRRLVLLVGLILLAALLADLARDSASPAAPSPAPTLTPVPASTAVPASPAQTDAPVPPSAPTVTNTPAPDPFGTRVAFTAEDGRELVGYFYSSWMPNAPVVVLMHEFGNNQAAWKESNIIAWMQNYGALDTSGQAYIYAGGRLPNLPKDRSFAVLTFDFRGHGESQPPLSGDLYQNRAGFLMDARAAYALARTLPGVDPSRVIGIGASVGADAVVDACGEICAGAFSVSPGGWLGIHYHDAAEAVLARGYPVRCMYAAKDDPSPSTCWSVNPNDLYRIYEYPGVKHGMTFFVPRKMEVGFGDNLMDFLLAASR